MAKRIIKRPNLNVEVENGRYKLNVLDNNKNINVSGTSVEKLNVQLRPSDKEFNIEGTATNTLDSSEKYYIGIDFEYTDNTKTAIKDIKDNGSSSEIKVDSVKLIEGKLRVPAIINTHKVISETWYLDLVQAKVFENNAYGTQIGNIVLDDNPPEKHITGIISLTSNNTTHFDINGSNETISFDKIDFYNNYLIPITCSYIENTSCTVEVMYMDSKSGDYTIALLLQNGNITTDTNTYGLSFTGTYTETLKNVPTVLVEDLKVIYDMIEQGNIPQIILEESNEESSIQHILTVDYAGKNIEGIDWVFTATNKHFTITCSNLGFELEQNS